MRLARCFRKQERLSDALAAYANLAALGDVPVADSPAELVARRERIALFNATGDRSAAAHERKVWDGDTSGTISQDGRSLSYNDWTAGHVGVRNLADGTARPVTVSDYNAFQSVISRDGTQVAYGWGNPETHRTELRTTSSQGSRVTPSRRLFASDDVNDITPMDWSPDGKMIAVGVRRADQTAQIGLVTVPEGSLRVLKSVDWRGPSRVFFSPDGPELGYDLPVSDTCTRQLRFCDRCLGTSRDSAASVRARLWEPSPGAPASATSDACSICLLRMHALPIISACNTRSAAFRRLSTTPYASAHVRPERA